MRRGSLRLVQTLLICSICLRHRRVVVECEELEEMFRRIGGFNLARPSDTFLLDVRGTGHKDVCISTHPPANPVRASVECVFNLTQQYENIRRSGVVRLMPLYKDFRWPNWVMVPPKGVWNQEATVVVADGFAVPGTSPGNMYAVGLDRQGQPRRVSRLLGNESDFTRLDKFYTYAEFHNFRRAEGVMDMLAGKVTKTSLSSRSATQYSRAELVLLRQPKDPFSEWAEMPVHEGVHVFATKYFPDGTHRLAVFGGAASGPGLELLVLDCSFYPPKLVHSSTIDKEIHAIKSIQLVDLTADKHDELLVSAHGTKAGGAGVYAYEIPFDMELLLLPKRVPRHELAVGFEVKHYAPLKGAPGFPMPFYLHGKRAGLGDLPYILLPGDDTGEVYILIPEYRFAYRRLLLAKFGSHVGKASALDIDDDGWVELIVPDNSFHRVHVYTSSPLQAVDSYKKIVPKSAILHARTFADKLQATLYNRVEHGKNMSKNAGRFGVRLMKDFLSSEGQSLSA